MGTRIEAAATVHERGMLRVRGALHMTDAAAKVCLHRAGHAPQQLDLLVNTGLYKDVNAAEPALAAIIQEDIGANPGTDYPAGHGTLAFDVLNGGCGVLTAARVVDSFVCDGNARHALIVAGDVDPSPHTSRQFPFSPAGGAMLLSHTAGKIGFRAIELHTFPEYAKTFEVLLRWAPHAGRLFPGRNIIDVRESPEFAPRCTELAAQVASEFLARHELAPAEIDLLITSQYPRMVALELGHRLGIPITRIPTVRAELALAHTAGPIAALEAAFDNDMFTRARTTLFVVVGAGITVGVGLYVNEEDSSTDRARTASASFITSKPRSAS